MAAAAGSTRLIFPFKIQANMDLVHRDRIAFFRICSGRFTRGMKVFRHREFVQRLETAESDPVDPLWTDEAVLMFIAGL